MLALLSRACKYENDDCYKVGEHLDKLLSASGKARNEDAGNIKSAEDVGGEYCALGLPECEDNDRDS